MRHSVALGQGPIIIGEISVVSDVLDATDMGMRVMKTMCTGVTLYVFTGSRYVLSALEGNCVTMKNITHIAALKNKI